MAWGRLDTSTLPLTAAHVLNAGLLRRFERYGASIGSILPDNAQEACGRAA